MYPYNQLVSIPLFLGIVFSFSECSAQITEWNRDDQLTIVKMTITPADEPVPALKHQLVLRPHQMRDGNAATHYLRSYPEGGFERALERLEERFGEEIYDWYSPDEFALEDLPEEAFETAQIFQSMTESFYEPASRCKEADWGHDLSHLKGVEIISFLLPEVQSARSISRILALQARIAMKEKRFDEAINLIRISFKLAQDINQSPFLVSSLVGIAINGITDQAVVEFIAQPDSPNLYWALAEMPSPPISVRRALRQEMQLAKRMFPVLDVPKEESLTYAEWNSRWNQFDQLSELHSAIGSNSQGTIKAGAFIGVATGFLGYSHAKRRLIEIGYEEDAVEDMAVGQVLSIYSSYAYSRLANEIEKRYYVPYHQKEFFKEDPWGGFEFFSNHPDREIVPVASILLPAVSSCMKAETRMARNHLALQAIEALRMHAARNDGQLPAKLSDVSCVPIPRNPATDKPFDYRLENGTAILELPESDGFHHGWRYEIRVAE